MVLVLAIYMSYFECLYYLFLNVKIRYKMQTGFLFKIGALLQTSHADTKVPINALFTLFFSTDTEVLWMHTKFCWSMHTKCDNLSIPLWLHNHNRVCR